MGLIPSIQTVIGEKGYSQLETFAITYKMLRLFLGFLLASDSYFLFCNSLKTEIKLIPILLPRKTYLPSDLCILRWDMNSAPLCTSLWNFQLVKYDAIFSFQLDFIVLNEILYFAFRKSIEIFLFMHFPFTIFFWIRREIHVIALSLINESDWFCVVFFCAIVWSMCRITKSVQSITIYCNVAHHGCNENKRSTHKQQYSKMF